MRSRTGEDSLDTIEEFISISWTKDSPFSVSKMSTQRHPLPFKVAGGALERARERARERGREIERDKKRTRS